MKFIALAFLGTVASQEVQAAAKAGTACTDSKGCGDEDTMCCGTATGGKICATEACTTLSTDTPNLMVCNNKTTAVEFILTQPNFDSTKKVYAKYPGGDSFACMAGAQALVASGMALLAAASMM